MKLFFNPAQVGDLVKIKESLDNAMYKNSRPAIYSDMTNVSEIIDKLDSMAGIAVMLYGDQVIFAKDFEDKNGSWFHDGFSFNPLLMYSPVDGYEHLNHYDQMKCFKRQFYIKINANEAISMVYGIEGMITYLGQVISYLEKGFSVELSKETWELGENDYTFFKRTLNMMLSDESSIGEFSNGLEEIISKFYLEEIAKIKETMDATGNHF